MIRIRTLVVALALTAVDASADVTSAPDAELSAIALQPIIISALANAVPLTATGRADVTDKLQKLQMRLDEAKNQKSVDAMKKLDDARKAAWDALDRAPRTDRSS